MKGRPPTYREDLPIPRGFVRAFIVSLDEYTHRGFPDNKMREIIESSFDLEPSHICKGLCFCNDDWTKDIPLGVRPV